MNGEERQLITGLFDRMRGVGAVEKDREAEALINQNVRQIPDAAYMLVQSVLVQENALQQAGERIEDLEARVRDLESQANRPAPQQSSGGFLGGLFGSGASTRSAPAADGGSVPPIRQGRPMGAPSGGGSAWGNAPGYGNAQSGGFGQQPQQAAGGGGGFMRSAMTTAAGVAGGMLVAGAISNMMKGDTAHAASSASSPLAGPETASTDTSNDPGTYDANDPGYQQASDDGNDPGWGGDDGGGDMDI